MWGSTHLLIGSWSPAWSGRPTCSELACWRSMSLRVVGPLGAAGHRCRRTRRGAAEQRAILSGADLAGGGGGDYCWCGDGERFPVGGVGWKLIIVEHVVAAAAEALAPVRRRGNLDLGTRLESWKSRHGTAGVPGCCTASRPSSWLSWPRIPWPKWSNKGFQEGTTLVWWTRPGATDWWRRQKKKTGGGKSSCWWWMSAGV